MKAEIDSEGRVVIPADIRREAGLEAGSAVEIRYSNGIIEIEPSYLPVRLVRKGRSLVAQPLVPVEPLTDEMVEETLEAMLLERMP